MIEMFIKIANISDLEEILKLQKLAYKSEAEIYNDYSIPPLLQTIDEIKMNLRIPYSKKQLKMKK